MSVVQLPRGQWRARTLFCGIDLVAIGGTRADARRGLVRLMTATISKEPRHGRR